ncbi:MAG: hypothetical protein JNM83_03035 [Myxococcales bacterium]|nr:hypothetical protein [Myxococcales bacterium]
MARVRKFNEPGAKEDRIRWNKSGTRKWLTVYTVMEYHPKSEAKASDPDEKPKASKAKPKKPKASKPKPTAKPKKPKATKTKSSKAKT